jgi:hypothetical protein
VVKRIDFFEKLFVANDNWVIYISTLYFKRGKYFGENPEKIMLVNPKRFRTIQDLTQIRPDCGASIDDIFIIDNGFLLIVDISHIGDILNPFNSPSASYVRSHGVFVGSYSCDDLFPVLWSDPFLLLPLSHHIQEQSKRYTDDENIVGNVSCPSGSFLMLPNREDVPMPLDRLTREALSSGGGAKIKLPNGTYRVFYEQLMPRREQNKNFIEILWFKGLTVVYFLALKPKQV